MREDRVANPDQRHRGQQPEPLRENEDEQGPRDELRQRDQAERNPRHSVVDRAARPHGGKDAEHKRQRDEQEHREQSEHGRVPDPLSDQARDRGGLAADRLTCDGGAEVPLDEAGKPVPVPLRRRPVQVQFLADRSESGRRRVATEDGARHVARKDVGAREKKDRDDEERHDARRDPPEHEARERVAAMPRRNPGEGELRSGELGHAALS